MAEAQGTTASWSWPSGTPSRLVKKAEEAFQQFSEEGKLASEQLPKCLYASGFYVDEEKLQQYNDELFSAPEPTAEQEEEGKAVEAEESQPSPISRETFFKFIVRHAVSTQENTIPLLKATGRGDIATIKSLLACGCDPNTTDGRGWSPVHAAAEFGQLEALEVLQELCDEDLEIDNPDKSGWTPLFNAASNGYTAVVQHLLASGCDVTEVDHTGRGAIHYAASSNHPDVVAALLQAGADANAQDKIGWTPLHCALIHGADKAVVVIVESSGSMDMKDILEYMPKHYAADKEMEDKLHNFLSAKAARLPSPRSPRA